MANRIRLILPILILGVGLPLLLAEEGFDFLRIDFNARTAALGGASVAGGHDVQSLAYNPATLFGGSDKQTVFTYLDYLVDIQSAFLGFQKQVGASGILGISAATLNYGDITRTNIHGEDLGTFTPGDLVLGLSYADSLAAGFLYGLTAKYISSSIDDYSASAAALDLGLIYPIPSQMMKIGLSITNAGKTLTAFIDEKEKLPMAIRAGISKRLAHLPLLVNVDVFRYLERESRMAGGVYFALGGEFTFSDHVLARFGYNSRGSEQKIGVDGERLTGISFGFGLRFSRIQLDYAHSSHGAIGETNYITVSTSF